MDNDEYDDLEDHINKHFPLPRGFGKRNRTVAVQVCQKMSSNTSQTEQQNTTKMPLEKKGEKNTLVCKRKLILVNEAEDLDVLSQGGIPQDILDQLNMEMSSSKRQKRLVIVENDIEAKSDHSPSHFHRNDTESTSQRWTKVDGMVKMEDNETARYQGVDKPETSNLDNSPSVDLFKKFIQKSVLNMTSDLGPKANLTERNRRPIWEKNIGEATKTNDALSDNDVLKDSLLELDKLMESSQNSLSNSSHSETYLKNFPPLEYDNYEDEGSKTIQSFENTNEIDIRSSESKFRSYYITAEEIMWDYGIDKPSQLISDRWSINLIDCGPYSYVMSAIYCLI